MNPASRTHAAPTLEEHARDYRSRTLALLAAALAARVRALLRGAPRWPAGRPSAC